MLLQESGVIKIRERFSPVFPSEVSCGDLGCTIQSPQKPALFVPHRHRFTCHLIIIIIIMSIVKREIRNRQQMR